LKLAESTLATVIDIVLESPQLPAIAYVIACTPALAVPGSKTPAFGSVIPLPDHVPPASAAVRFKAASFAQNGPAAEIVASKFELITRTCLEQWQSRGIVYQHRILEHCFQLRSDQTGHRRYGRDFSSSPIYIQCQYGQWQHDHERAGNRWRAVSHPGGARHYFNKKCQILLPHTRLNRICSREPHQLHTSQFIALPCKQ